MGTQIEVARRAGVSQAVVSAVISGSTHTRMSEQTRQRVLQAIDELGYVPNSAARALRSRKAGSIAVVAKKLDNPVYQDLFQGIHEAAEHRGWAVVVGDLTWMHPGSHFLTRLLGRGAIDGIILRQDGLLDTEVLDLLQERPAPVVQLMQRRDGDGHWLSIDDHAAGRVATERLLGQGHTQIAYVGGDPAMPSLVRYQGYAAALTAAGLEPLPQVATGFGLEAGRSGLDAVRSQHPGVTAVVVNNVMTGVALLGHALAVGLSVPRDLSVVAIHDAPEADYCFPALTTVKLPMLQLGKAAVELIGDALSEKETVSRVLSDPAPELVVRASDGPAAR